MLDRKKLSKDPEYYRKQLKRRGQTAVDAIEPLFEIEQRWKSLKSEADELRHRQKEMGPQMGRLDKASDAFKELRGEMAAVSKRVKELETEIKSLEEKRRALLLLVPNLCHPSVPDGAGEEDNEEVARWGELPRFDFTPQPHWELGTALGILDFESAAKMSGARFAVLRGAGALLERGLARFMLELHTREHGYTEIWPPYLVKYHAMEGTAQLPNLADDCYHTAGEDPYFLIPTAEVPLVNLHRQEILSPESLPLDYVAYTPCFRAEAGSHGQDVRGLIRQHQFDKVELVKIAHPQDSYQALETLRDHAEQVLRRLELPYRTVLLCSGDMGFAAAKTYDLEVWLPGQNRYREISSCSNCEDFQARRARVRYRHAKGDNRLCHTLNGSALAIGRTLIALLENGQQKDGSVRIPKALQPYVEGLEVLRPD
jgi:seryl-tRNA synthetase